MKPIRWVISLIFILQMYVMMPIFGLVFLPWALVSPKGAHTACWLYARYVMWTARWMVGIKHEVRGTPPTEECLVAAKHQSFFDIIIIFSHVPWGKFIMKRELLYAPIIGQYSYRLGCVPVARGKRAEAIKKMVKDVQAGLANPGQLCIYPQGTRVSPGAQTSYKVGTYALYRELGQPCVPVAVNVGLFWPRKGIMRTPGTAVVEFLEPIEPGLDQAAFMERLETAIETRSNELMAEAGFTG
ncbi:MAG: lysophospholipid acyltransferase family protein [Pseudomonadota bacterium]